MQTLRSIVWGTTRGPAVWCLVTTDTTRKARSNGEQRGYEREAPQSSKKVSAFASHYKMTIGMNSNEVKKPGCMIAIWVIGFCGALGVPGST